MDAVVTSTTPAPPTSARSAEPSIVDVIGELDVASAAELRARIARAAADSTRPIVVELSGVSFVDCAGLGALLSAQTRLGRRLSLHGMSEPVAWLVELAGLRATFDSPDERPAAQS